MTKKLRFQLLNGQFLVALDERNWSIGIDVEKKNGSGTREKLLTFHLTLESAWRSCVNDNLLTAKTKDELGKIIEQLRELKKPFFNQK